MARRPIRIAVLHFAHETVTFLKNDTTLDDFIYEGSPARGEALLAHDPKSYMGGFVKVAREFDGSSWSASNRRCGQRRERHPAGSRGTPTRPSLAA